MEIINIYRESRPHTYCGRPSALGNPYVLGRDGTRDEIIDKYEIWLENKIRNNDILIIEAMQSLSHDSVLGCYCRPKRCHCDVIVKLWYKHFHKTNDN